MDLYVIPKDETAAQQLIDHKIPMLKNQDTNTWIAMKATKIDRFYRINGVIVPKSFLSLVVVSQEIPAFDPEKLLARVSNALNQSRES